VDDVFFDRLFVGARYGRLHRNNNNEVKMKDFLMAMAAAVTIIFMSFILGVFAILAMRWLG
jgi:hypothetical protein